MRWGLYQVILKGKKALGPVIDQKVALRRDILPGPGGMVVAVGDLVEGLGQLREGDAAAVNAEGYGLVGVADEGLDEVVRQVGLAGGLVNESVAQGVEGELFVFDADGGEVAAEAFAEDIARGAGGGDGSVMEEALVAELADGFHVFQEAEVDNVLVQGHLALAGVVFERFAFTVFIEVQINDGAFAADVGDQQLDDLAQAHAGVEAEDGHPVHVVLDEVGAFFVSAELLLEVCGVAGEHGAGEELVEFFGGEWEALVFVAAPVQAFKFGQLPGGQAVGVLAPADEGAQGEDVFVDGGGGKLG